MRKICVYSEMFECWLIRLCVFIRIGIKINVTKWKICNIESEINKQKFEGKKIYRTKR